MLRKKWCWSVKVIAVGLCGRYDGILDGIGNEAGG